MNKEISDKQNKQVDEAAQILAELLMSVVVKKYSQPIVTLEKKVEENYLEDKLI